MIPPESDPRARLRHDLRTPLTVIHGSAQLLGRLLAATQSLPPDERTRLQDRLAALEAAEAVQRERIEALTDEPAGDGDARLRATQATPARTRAQIEDSHNLLRRVHQRP